MYKVLSAFFDLKDSNREYRPGDTFPRDGLTVDAARLAELASSNNRLGFPVIQEIKEQKTTRKRVKTGAD
jgi:hypothetical protein